MAFIPTLNCVQARLQWQHDSGSVAENIFYCATESAPTPTDLDEIGAAFGTWLVESWIVAHNQVWAATGVRLRAMNEEEGLEILYTDDFPYEGNDTGAPVSNQVCYTVTWGTGLSGRSARGRSYGLGLSISQTINQNRLADAVQVDYTVRWGNLITVMAAAGHALQVVSFVDAGVPRAAGRKLPILSANARFPLATQRRRLS